MQVLIGMGAARADGNPVLARPAQVLTSPRRPLPQPLSHGLQAVQQQWTGPMARLSREWCRWVGTTMADHCRPFSLHGGTLMVAVDGAHWLQALQYSRHQLLGRLQAAGFAIRELRLQHRAPQPLATLDLKQQQGDWEQHPSYSNGEKQPCGRCGAPTPPRELQRWGHCCFCQRQSLPAPPQPG